MSIPASEARRNKTDRLSSLLIDADCAVSRKRDDHSTSFLRYILNRAAVIAGASSPYRTTIRRTTMNTFKNLIAAALVSMTTVTSASAQLPTWAVSEPAAFEAQYPDRDILNGGALTPAGRMGLELPGGAAPAFGANTARACGNRSCYHLILRPTLFSSRSFPRKSQSHTVVGLRPRQNRSLKSDNNEGLCHWHCSHVRP